MSVTGNELKALGFPQGRGFGEALAHVNAAGLEGPALARWVEENRPAPKMRPQTGRDYVLNLEAETPEEAENLEKVRGTMDALMRTPTLRHGAVMPDACPAGPVGTIPVGGVVAAEGAIHPGMHSADICCSVMVTEFEGSDPATVLDAIGAVTHFGPGGRRDGRFALPEALRDRFAGNAFLGDPAILAQAGEHMGTQGDGNHFAFVGVSREKGTVCLVTHHGSRGPGAALYKRGMRAAEAWRGRLSEGVAKENAWIPFDSDEGRAYWEALQAIRDWTKANHDCLHDAATQGAGATVRERFWNEHNFVFREGDLFWHAKGATPVTAAMLPDTNGTQIVPLNMAEPVLLIRGERGPRNHGFAPHGAGRNLSRTAHRRGLGEHDEAEVFARETAGIDARFHCGKIDVSELPSAYKPAATVRAQMARFGLAEVVDEIMPHGSIMAGDWERDAPWRRKRDAKAQAGRTA